VEESKKLYPYFCGIIRQRRSKKKGWGQNPRLLEEERSSSFGKKKKGRRTKIKAPTTGEKNVMSAGTANRPKRKFLSKTAAKESP